MNEIEGFLLAIQCNVMHLYIHLNSGIHKPPFTNNEKCYVGSVMLDKVFTKCLCVCVLCIMYRKVVWQIFTSSYHAMRQNGIAIVYCMYKIIVITDR